MYVPPPASYMGVVLDRVVVHRNVQASGGTFRPTDVA